MIQLPLPIDWRGAAAARHVVRGEANRQALELLTRPALWPSHCLLLVGPPRSGRSTMAAEAAGAGGVVVIDDADRADETTLFHAWNRAREAGERLILIAADAPPAWSIALPDLRSRLSAAAVARIERPDEALAAELLAEGLAGGGTAFAPDVPGFLAARLPRDYALLEQAVALLTRDSLASGGKISVARAKLALEQAGFLA